METTKFKKLITYINKRGVGSKLYRHTMLLILEDNLTRREFAMDKYRKALERAGYLSRVSQGVYKVEKLIEEDLSWRKLHKQVYGLRKSEVIAGE